jgi:ribosomal silencing factor RsfS
MQAEARDFYDLERLWNPALKENLSSDVEPRL